ncbi:hypothetical protein A1O3_05678 [Capronia epimyces CBS 606.96]|uniref:Xylanolytic transcriptional activator regulatory domain-containing protein n=1 Tax=Capronia epimyces CBS 606.96 TaxID=1182542 RepID=W9XXQ1_9EURO|nr:uncharacterized protein A1O3_05678 [Capronia epimyces CBS 606.96]EXJ85003.1 hypothetical protein A1O3_05678 [Capronia epimyces CBS 606.96]
MKCHAQKNSQLSPTSSSARKNTFSKGVTPKPSQDSFDHKSPTAATNAAYTSIPLMQILSPSDYFPPQETESHQQARYASIEVPKSNFDAAGNSSHAFNMQLSSASWSVSSPVNSINRYPQSPQLQKQSSSQNSGEASTFENSVPAPGNPGQLSKSEIHPNQFINSHIGWLPPSDHANQDNLYDPLQMWLLPSFEDLDQSPENFQAYESGDLQRQYPGQRDLANGRIYDSLDTIRTISKVPRERFSRIQRCWGPRSGHNYRIMPVLWKEVASSPTGNLFSGAAFAADDFRTASGWGINNDCRVRLRDAFHLSAPLTLHSPQLQAVVDPALCQVNEEFPPAEILDIALGLFFRRFHPTIPFIHIATFSVQHTPTPMLSAICLIGLSILGTTGATRFVSSMFPRFLQRVCNDLSACAGCSVSLTQQLSIFATAFLTLNLSVATGDKATLDECQMLYASLISIAQQNGLFAADDGQPLDTILSEMTESDDQWKSWSRIESAKRLILGLLLADSWYSNLLSKAPIIRSESVCVFAPCSESLFQAKSATQWQSILRSGESQNAPSFRLEDLHQHDTEPIGKLGYLGRSSFLALLQIQILEAYQRLMPSDQLATGSFIPWHVYSGDARAKTLIPAVLAANYTAGPLWNVDDTSCVVLWHSLCIMLLADLPMFEVASGRHGAAPATGALENISQWSQSQSARRACVHAAQTFKLMSERRVSDNATIHSIKALFASALVLGLYLFMVNPGSVSRQNAAPVEIINSEPDWIELQDLGFRDRTLLQPTERGLRTNREDEQSFSSIYQFIKHGGTISLNGVVHQAGYESARRVLLDFANLMDGISGRRLRTFTQVLHIMSDDLMNVDPLL